MNSEDDFKLEGEIISTKTLVRSWDEVYKAHINSSKWKNIKEALFKLRGRKCESKLCVEQSSQLEVHHLHYETFGNERFSDLMIVCSSCHPKEDREREKKTEYRKESRRMEKAFQTYMEKKVGHGWEKYNSEADYEEFLEWLETKRLDEYYR